MFAPLLATAALLAPLQDGAPTETPEAVREFIQEIEDQLYRPQEHGLRTLEFDLPARNAMFGHVGNAHVSWALDEDWSIDVEVLDFEIPPQMAAMIPDKEVVKRGIPAEVTQKAETILTTLAGVGFSSMLDEYIATLDGTEEEYVKVRLDLKAGIDSPMASQTLYVKDSMVAMAKATIPSPMGDVPVTIDFAWKPVAEDSYVLDTQTMTAKITTPMGEMEQKTVLNFDYREIGDIHLLVGTRTEITAPMMGSQTVEEQMENIVVNGDPLDGDPADDDSGEG